MTQPPDLPPSALFSGKSVLQTSVTIILLMLVVAVQAQQVDLNNIGKTFKQKPVAVGGGISASGIFYDGNDGQGRQPFTYFLNGNVNVSLFSQVNLPFSFNFTNLGANYGYPTLPNRLSVHPTYKWVTGHIGDVAMSFSPYTLNGHMFTGVGVDLTPKGPFKFSAMYGRLQRAVEYDSGNSLVLAAYKRMGYGAKMRYDQKDHFLGMTFFTAKDDPESLSMHPDSLNIFPQRNVAFSWEAGITLLENLSLSAEYGLSFLTRDVRAPEENSGMFNQLLGNTTSTHSYGAIKAQINYQLLKNTIGVGYERIDPEYKTLGAYFFNNDYENLTLNYSRPFLKDQITMALSWGVQRDDLNNDKEQSSKRFVSSANITYTPNDKFNASLSYSSFQTYMNVRSQFEYINGQTPYDNLDTLDFTQLSQNLALNAMYNFGKVDTRKHNINVNLAFQQAADKQGDIVRTGNLSQFYNMSTAYSLLFVPEAVSLMAAINTTFNKAGGEQFVIVGPTLGVRARVLKKMLTTGINSSYNVSYNNGMAQSKVLNIRLNAGYVFFKKHTLSINGIWQQRDIETRGQTKSITAILAYAYNF